MSHNARAWHYVRPDQSFVPHGASGSFDCCGVFIAKQNPSLTPAYAAGSDKLPLFTLLQVEPLEAVEVAQVEVLEEAL